ncbi:diguanylate cyclase (GGDEF) domain-containing protein [Marinospirillum celere]|uniref:diguanylate cyclase n=1 Tax=Marinospirillum celere TaxID=1122252 RepID=A0A1I1DYL3_9GAMM|nr:diguanylate cyclase [Marinospirillum celere]SFB79516.1 diguanylate cyclase (GGDEF) domain-containing protein [Marinospirillum celere]
MVNSNPIGTPKDRLEALKESYLSRLESNLNHLELLAGRLLEKAQSDEYLEELHSTLHSISGSAGSFGFNQVGQQARRFEQATAKILNQANAPDEPLPAREWIAQLRASLESDKKQKASASIESSSTSKADGNTCIWLIERDAILAEFTAQQLKSFGFEVHHITDLQELNNPSKPAPDLLLIDHRANQTLSAKPEHLGSWKTLLKDFTCPKYFFGAEDTFDARLQALRNDGKGYFVKPLNMISLTRHISELFQVESSEPGRVMILETNSRLSQTLQTALEQADMLVYSLSEPQQLFESLNEFNPELILLDLWLTEVNGQELTALLSQVERWAHLPIIYIANESNSSLKNQALLMGGGIFLEQPIDTELLARLCKSQVHKLRQLEASRSKDALTGLLKHASIKEAIQSHWNYVQRQPQTFSLVMLDIDHFKQVNDTYGHPVGDLVISAVGTLLRQHFRSTDKLGRYGGEEFTLLLVDCEADDAFKMVDNLREAFEAIKFSSGDTYFSCTLSAGVLDNKQFSDASADALIEHADKALYQAKQSGRNRVCLACA